MTDCFKEFIKAEVCEMMLSMDEETLLDPQKSYACTLAWVEKNAENFRAQWNAAKERAITALARQNQEHPCSGMN